MSNRFFVSQGLVDPIVDLAGGEAHHLRNVLRCRVGDFVSLFDGRGAEADAEIVRISKRSVTVEVRHRRSVSCHETQSLILATAVPKGDRFRWLVEKATELGVSRFIPLTTARSVVEPSPGKLDRARQTVIESAKQCGRSYLMQIDEVMDWTSFVQTELISERTLVAHPAAAQPGASLVEEMINTQKPIVVATGPEGGFTDDEIELALQSGATLVGLGSRILRIETAALVLTALFSATSGFGSP